MLKRVLHPVAIIRGQWTRMGAIISYLLEPQLCVLSSMYVLQNITSNITL